MTTGAAQTYSAQSDFVRYALGMELNAVPGTLFAYNPLAYSLLPDIVRKVSRKPIDSFLAERLFGALGIDRFYWLSDAAKNRLGMSGLHVGPRDLATIGQLLVARGAWRGRQIISQRWLRAALQAQSRLIRNTGLFWWLIYERSDHMVTDADIARWRAAGIAHKLVDRVAELDNQPLATAAYIAALRGRLGDAGLDEWTRALASAHTAGASLQWGKLVGCSARGNLGQYLLVYPAQQLVIARMISSAGHASDDDGFDDIFALGAALAGIPRA